MNARRVRFTATAEQHVKRERTWWIKNRDHQDIFATEIERALAILAVVPGSGTFYKRTVKTLRRRFVRKIACHIYYTFNDDEITVVALWGARRKRGPSKET